MNNRLTPGLWRRWMKWVLLIVFLGGVAAACCVVWLRSDAALEEETDRLAALLELRPGMTVAEIGAGEGRMTLQMAWRVGPSGQVFSTELNTEKLQHIQETVAEAKLENVSVLQAGETETSLPPECCDASFMVKVYHHFSDPPKINADISQALRPGGRLAVIDFPPSFWRFWIPPPNGIPKSHGGHGTPRDVLIKELRTAGFELERVIDGWRPWPESLYCVVVWKPEKMGSLKP